MTIEERLRDNRDNVVTPEDDANLDDWVDSVILRNDTQHPDWLGGMETEDEFWSHTD